MHYLLVGLVVYALLFCASLLAALALLRAGGKDEVAPVEPTLLASSTSARRALPNPVVDLEHEVVTAGVPEMSVVDFDRMHLTTYSA